MDEPSGSKGSESRTPVNAIRARFVLLLLVPLCAILFLLYSLFGRGITSPYSAAPQPNPQFVETDPPYMVTFRGEVSRTPDGGFVVSPRASFFEPSMSGWSFPSLIRSDYRILLYKGGELTVDQPMEVRKCTVEVLDAPCPEFDYTQGTYDHHIRGLGTLPDEIAITYRGEPIFNLERPSSNPPPFRIYSQELTYREESLRDAITIQWEPQLEEASYSYFAIAYVNDDQGGTFWGEGTGSPLWEDTEFEGDSFVVDPYNFMFYPPYTLQFRIFASDGFRTFEAASDKFHVEDRPRFASIRQPVNEGSYPQRYVPLEAISYNPVTGLHCMGCAEEGNAFRWISSIDGEIATSARTYCRALSPGRHQITLIVENNNGMRTSHTVEIEVTDPGEDWEERQRNGSTCY
jgi:hypothetical protein